MEPAKRMIANTGIQYVKAIITTCFSFYATRLVLDVLNVSDYGIYTAIAGVVAMLGFITNSLLITTQRFLSFHQQDATSGILRKIFVNSLFIHEVFGFLLAAILILLEAFLFNQVLNIDADRVETAKDVYLLTVLMLFVTIITAPFKALFIAHENITFIAVVEIVDSILKLVLALILPFVTLDRLWVYVLVLTLILCLNLLVFAVYGLLRYSECTLLVSRSAIDRVFIRKMTGFASWTTYGMGCVAARNQGTAVVLNHFWGTAVNAAYGLAFQVNGAISFLVVSILNAMNPQLMRAEGACEREKMLRMAARQSKFSVAILAIFLIPLIVEMPAALAIWLKDVPPYTSMFCRFVLLTFLLDQITLGLSSANQAIGDIRNFTLLTYTPKLLYLPAIWLMFECGCSVRSVMVLYVLVELVVALSRIPFMKYKAGLHVWGYLTTVVFPVTLQCVATWFVCWLVVESVDIPFRFLLTMGVAALTGLLGTWLFVLDHDERMYARVLLSKLMKV
jgi:O-antigen/teichoic acid export membrane protein